ncbi:hypothetical protein LPB140_02600 [Sphingorhabdus lutea]|uniref:Uncharacterized protein n=1 Tax=Sphingorhabdus lutea TaxID=1913578 RepID=A0A1L3J9T6_9SPHN|nr:hypothetical protein LPB140_02600 [Sphingorhabdus lutea]
MSVDKLSRLNKASLLYAAEISAAIINNDLSSLLEKYFWHKKGGSDAPFSYEHSDKRINDSL